MILLDTHVWVWWVNGSPMGSKDMLRTHVKIAG
jgi:PIN domain nuclease of toxin-antitoxin system